MRKRKRLKLEQVQPNLFAVHDYESAKPIGYVLYAILQEKWWLYDQDSRKLNGEYDSRSTAVRNLARQMMVV